MTIRVEHKRGLTRAEAWRFASHRAIIGMSGSIFAFVITMSFFVLIPKVEASFFPVVRTFDVIPVPVPDQFGPNIGNRVAFRVRFDKVRDCRPAGRAFYGLLSDGTIYRLNAEQPDLDTATVGTGRPLGMNIGGRIVLTLPPNTISISGEQVYDCGWPWAALHQTIGPFDADSLRR